MPLSLHLSIHLLLALLSGYLVGRATGRPLIGLVAGFAGGFLIDTDHIFEYLLVFGWNFNFSHFLEGREFLVSNTIHLWFHVWEYVPFLLLAAWAFRRHEAVKTIVLALAMAVSIHLLSDSLINSFPPKYYSLLYRQSVNYSAEKLLSPEQYQENLERKAELGI